MAITDLTNVVAVTTASGATADFWDELAAEAFRVNPASKDGWRGYEGPLYAPNPWDTVSIGGIQIPGICSVKSGSIEKRIDIQKPHGRDGGALIERGIIPGKFDIDVTLWTPEQWSRFKDVVRLLITPAGKIGLTERKQKFATDSDVKLAADSAKLIQHPGLNALQITQAIVQRITVPTPGPDVGYFTSTISCVQYIAPGKRSAVRKPHGVAPPQRDPAFDRKPTVNKPTSPAKTDAGPNGPPTTAHGPR